MNRNPLLIVLLAALLLAGAATWLLTRDPPAEQGGAALHRASDAAPEKPSFHRENPEDHAAPMRPVPIESLPATAEPASPAHAAPTGPVRRITGRVLRQADGSPLGGAVVARVKEENKVRSPADGGSTSDPADGTFTLADVPLAERQLCVSLNDSWPRQTAFYPLPDVAGDIEGLALTYDSGFLLRGLVTDLSGTPLAGAAASIDEHAPVTTDTAGRFELRDVSPGKSRISVDVWAEARWFVRATSAVAAPKDSTQVANVVLKLAGSGAIEGRITDPEGKPVGDADVRLAASIDSAHAEASAAHLRTTSGADGNYRLDHVPEGRYLVEVGTDSFAFTGVSGDPSQPDTAAKMLVAVARNESHRGRGLAPRWFPGIEVRTGQATRLDVELDHGAIIEGRVTDASGTRLSGAKVTLERAIRWPAPDQNGSSISFDGTNTITSSGGAEGQPGQTVFSSTERSAETGEDGSYRFEVVSAGDKRLTAIDAKQLCSPRKAELTVLGTELHTAVDFVLDFGLSLRGRVTDPGGAPLEGVSVNVKPEGTQLFTSEGAVHTGEDGWFEVIGLAEGRHSMMLNKAGYSYRSESVLPGEVPRTWILQPAPKLHGLVLDAVTNDPLLHAIAVPHSIMKSGDEDHPEGRFEVDVDDDTPTSVTIEVVGYESETKENVIPSTTSGAPMVFRLKPKQ